MGLQWFPPIRNPFGIFRRRRSTLHLRRKGKKKDGSAEICFRAEKGDLKRGAKEGEGGRGSGRWREGGREGGEREREREKEGEGKRGLVDNDMPPHASAMRHHLFEEDVAAVAVRSVPLLSRGRQEAEKG